MSEDRQTRLTLIQRIQQKQRDEHCWEDFVSSYRGYICAIINNFNIDKALVDDLLQEVLLKLWKTMDRFKYEPEKCRFRTWLSMVTCSIAKDYLKSRAGRDSKNKIELHEELNQTTPPEIELIAEREWKLFIAEQAYENVKDSLSNKVAAVFELVMQDVLDGEIEQRLGIASSSVRVYKQRARNAFLKEVFRLNKELDC